LKNQYYYLLFIFIFKR